MVQQRQQQQPCVFCEIAAGRAPARVLTQTDTAMAILDASPVRRGHTLVIPKLHVTDIADPLAVESFAAMAVPLHAAALMLLDRLGASGLTCIQANGATAGQDIAHLHVHLVPRFAGDGRLTNWVRDPHERDDVDGVFRQLTREVT